MKRLYFFILLLISNAVCLHADSTDVISKMIENALWQTGVTTGYDPAYRRLDYPGGDVDIETGVCTDVVIRAFRAVKIDLQVLIHEDMKAHFSKYPKNWGLKKPDRNIDHRRVPNIMTYLKRKKMDLPVTQKGSDYKPGDLVTWKIPGNLDHIGIVVDVPVKGTDRFMVVHNIGRGARMEDVLFEFEVTGHFRYFKLD
ncbi:MAG: DUF1287 domain-containing protein [Chitinispirillaceae bacterium]